MRNFDKKSDRPFRSERRTAADGAPFRKSSKPLVKRNRASDKDEKPFRKEEKPFGKPDRSFGKTERSFGRSERSFGKPKRSFNKDEKSFKSDERPASRVVKRADKPFGKDEGKFRTEERPRRRIGSTGRRTEESFGKSESRYSNREKQYRTSEKPYRKTEKPVRKSVVKSIKKSDDGSLRLNKYIANSGICSRREADNYITAGLVSVNGTVVTQLGTKVFPTDDIRFNGERLKGEQKVYILMNKPKDFVTTTSDPHAEKTVLELVRGKCKQRVFPVGRLDKATTGVLLLTNDGELAESLTHPSKERKKIYHIHLDKNLNATDFNKILEGFSLDDGEIHADALSYIEEDKSQLGMEIHSGRNRIVRRIFEHLGYKVKKLDRVYFAGLTKKNLRRGQWRFLSEEEIAFLKMGSID